MDYSTSDLCKSMLRARERLAIRTVLPTLTTARPFVALEKSFSPIETIAPDGLATGGAGGDIVFWAGSLTLFEWNREIFRRKSSANGRVERQGADGSSSFFGPDFDVEWLLVGTVWNGGFGPRWRIDGHFLNGLRKGFQAQGCLKVMIAGAILIRQVDCGSLKAAESVLVVFELFEKGDKFGVRGDGGQGTESLTEDEEDQ